METLVMIGIGVVIGFVLYPFYLQYNASVALREQRAREEWRQKQREAALRATDPQEPAREKLRAQLQASQEIRRAEEESQRAFRSLTRGMKFAQRKGK